MIYQVAHVTETKRGQGSQGTGQPACLPAARLQLSGLIQEILKCGPALHSSIVHPSLLIELIERLLEKIENSIAQHVGMRDDFIEFLEPGLGVGPRRRNQRVEGEWGYGPADCVDLRVLEQRAC